MMPAASLLDVNQTVWSVEVSGRSMEPTIRLGEHVLVRAVPAATGHVVLIRAGDELLLHRLVASVGFGRWKRWIHLGDARGAHPGICAAQQILGVADLPAWQFSRRQQIAWIGRWLLRSGKSTGGR